MRAAGDRRSSVERSVFDLSLSPRRRDAGRTLGTNFGGGLELFSVPDLEPIRTCGCRRAGWGASRRRTILHLRRPRRPRLDPRREAPGSRGPSARRGPPSVVGAISALDGRLLATTSTTARPGGDAAPGTPDRRPADRAPAATPRRRVHPARGATSRACDASAAATCGTCARTRGINARAPLPGAWLPAPSGSRAARPRLRARGYCSSASRTPRPTSTAPVNRSTRRSHAPSTNARRVRATP